MTSGHSYSSSDLLVQLGETGYSGLSLSAVAFKLLKDRFDRTVVQIKGACQLFLSTGDPSNAVYADASGSSQYKVSTPFGVHHRTTSISRVVERDIPRRWSSSSNGTIATSDADGGDRFALLARIDWKLLESSVIHFRGRELATGEFFRKEGLGLYGRHRVFTARDGREFKWILGAYTSELKLNGSGEIRAAIYRHKTLGLFSRPRKASIEIFPPFEDMLDEIMVTFVYIEQLRKTREHLRLDK
ncbi:hypothetical protein B0H16DRAFT_1413193 [Mycena metata]|uniref:DUF6593 domain-containing protein n=1 Tax=Mycena metata TaxID=1033252 RepID=A0AAD7JIR0_9AGAR|nr:hypothetical protein B0H16DRAFT_1413193 [Mycena metata]